MYQAESGAEISVAGEALWHVLSRSAEYALRAVLNMAARAEGERAQAVHIAQELAVPERYLARVLNALAHAGVLESARGAGGGFRLRTPARDLTLSQVVAPFDAVGSQQQCLLRRQSCGREPCVAHHAWKDVAASVTSFFQRTTVEDLLRGQ